MHNSKTSDDKAQGPHTQLYNPRYLCKTTTNIARDPEEGIQPRGLHVPRGQTKNRKPVFTRKLRVISHTSQAAGTAVQEG